ncbi:MAG TPA: hypothetical protein VN633_19090 [Bryobacteraceae bacterium]|nr:hypothetical protein [Bryobacteraceae bacterium]
MKRRSFLKGAAGSYLAASASAQSSASPSLPKGNYRPGRIENHYSLFLDGEREALEQKLSVAFHADHSLTATVAGSSQSLKPGDSVGGWQLLAVAQMNGTATAVFEKHVTHQGAIVYVTEAEGEILRVPKHVGQLSSVAPRATNTPHGIRFTRPAPYVPGPDRLGNYILNSSEDPCYENIAALGAEYIGYTLVANEQAGPLRSLFLEAAGVSRQLSSQPEGQGLWAPDLVGAVFDPSHFFPVDEPSVFRYKPGYSKRTLLGGYLPAADIAVWNPDSRCGYEAMVLLPPGEDARPVGRVRFVIAPAFANRVSASHMQKLPDGSVVVERYWNTSAEGFFSTVAGVANHWIHFFNDRMRADIPDPWLLDAARAGITLSRCSYRGLEPTYQIGEGAYTKIPERSHALFPVAHYEFVWAHQLWNLDREVTPYFQHYLEKYILPDGNFLYNTQDQVEAPLNTGIFLWNSARSYDYTRNLEALKARLPVLRRMIGYVLDRYEYSKTTFSADDPRHGLIWGSPEADLGEPANDYPNSHPFYFQNSTWTWRGLREHARCLELAAKEHNIADWAEESRRVAATAAEMRSLITKSLERTLAAMNPPMRQAAITPFSPDDLHRDPKHLTSYENHRFMMDWFTSDWGDKSLDAGHFKHREIAGEQILGLHTDGALARTSNFMEHGTLAGRIRQDDYRPFLLTLYALVCYAADCGNRYSPEDAFLPGSYPGEGSPYGWSSVINSVLQPALGLRWLLCYEESDDDRCHLQKAAPMHWFSKGQTIAVENCPTRFGTLSWRTRATDSREWTVTLDFENNFQGDLAIHIHPPDRRPLASTSIGALNGTVITLKQADLVGKSHLEIQVH